MKPDISVITVNYNGLELTAAMIASLRQYVSTPIETIVVDNGSLRDEAHLLAERFPGIVAIRSERNLGLPEATTSDCVPHGGATCCC